MHNGRARQYFYTLAFLFALTCALPTHAAFLTTLQEGDIAEDVRTLQTFLNTHGFSVADSGPGSPGSETNIFGPATKAALIRFQEAYRDDILAPIGVTTGTGYFGPSTLKKVNELHATTDPEESLAKQVTAAHNNPDAAEDNETDYLTQEDFEYLLKQIERNLKQSLHNSDRMEYTSPIERLAGITLHYPTVADRLSFSRTSTPSDTTDTLYNTGGDLYWQNDIIAGGGVGTWASDGTNVWRTGGNVGIGATELEYSLEVDGQIRADNLTPYAQTFQDARWSAYAEGTWVKMARIHLPTQYALVTLELDIKNGGTWFTGGSARLFLYFKRQYFTSPYEQFTLLSSVAPLSPRSFGYVESAEHDYYDIWIRVENTGSAYQVQPQNLIAHSGGYLELINSGETSAEPPENLVYPQANGFVSSADNSDYDHTLENDVLTNRGLSTDSNLSLINLTDASSTTNESSPKLFLQGRYWNGTASKLDDWVIESSLGSGTDPSSTLLFSHAGTPGNTGYAFMDGSVGIGTTSLSEKLTVVGNVYADAFIDNGITIGAPDYVFDDPNYQELTLAEIEAFVEENAHLPWLTPRGPGAMSLSARINEALEALENLFLRVFDLAARLVNVEDDVAQLKNRDTIVYETGDRITELEEENTMQAAEIELLKSQLADLLNTDVEDSTPDSNIPAPADTGEGQESDTTDEDLAPEPEEYAQPEDGDSVDVEPETDAAPTDDATQPIETEPEAPQQKQEGASVDTEQDIAADDTSDAADAGTPADAAEELTL